MLDPPIPTAAVWSGFFFTAAVQFNHQLQTVVSADRANWFVRKTNLARPVVSVGISGTQVTVLTSGSITDIGPDVVSFSPPPFDVVSDTAKPTPAPAFADFPLA